MAQRATSLRPQPSFFCVSFPLLACSKKNPLLPPKQGHFGIFFSVSLYLSLALFCLALFHFISLSLSLSLVFFFLPSLLSLFLFFFVPCFCFLFFPLGFCFMKKQHQNSLLQSVFSIISLAWVSCFVIFSIPFFFLFNMNVFKISKRRQVKNT